MRLISLPRGDRAAALTSLPGQHLLEAVEGAAPAAAMAVPALDRLEHGLAEGHPRAMASLVEGDRHQGLMAWQAVFLVPGEGEHQPLGFDHLAIDPALPQLLAVLVPPQTGAPASPGTNIAFGVGRGVA